MMMQDLGMLLVVLAGWWVMCLALQGARWGVVDGRLERWEGWRDVVVAALAVGWLVVRGVVSFQ